MKKIVTSVLVLLCSFSLIAENFTLDKCLELARKNNVNLMISQKNVEISQKKLTDSENGFWDLGISGNTTGSFSQSKYSDDLRSDNDNKFMQINLSLDLSAKLSKPLLNNVQISENNLAMNKLDKSNEELVLEYNIISKYLSVLIAREQLVVNKEKVKYSKSEYEETKLKYELGSLTRSDLLESEVGLSSAKLEIIRSENSLSKLKQQLINLIPLNVTPGEFDVTDLNAVKELNDQIQLDKLIDTALEKRYDYQTKLLSVKNYELSLSSEKATWLPEASVSGRAGLTNNQMFEDTYRYAETDAEKYDGNYTSSEISIRGTLSWDLTYDDFNSIDQAKLTLKKEQLALDKLKQDIKSDIKESYYDYLSEKENLSMVDKHVELAKENLELANEMFKIGSKTIGERIKAKNDYISALFKKISARYSFLNAYYTLLNTAGIENKSAGVK